MINTNFWKFFPYPTLFFRYLVLIDMQMTYDLYTALEYYEYFLRSFNKLTLKFCRLLQLIKRNVIA